jgi:multiple antibiotic resistance protein
MIMLYARQESNDLKISLALFLSWLGVLSVMIAAPHLQRLIGKKGMIALEQVMGMVLAMVSIEMVANGVRLFVGRF